MLDHPTASPSKLPTHQAIAIARATSIIQYHSNPSHFISLLTVTVRGKKCIQCLFYEVLTGIPAVNRLLAMGKEGISYGCCHIPGSEISTQPLLEKTHSKSLQNKRCHCGASASLLFLSLQLPQHLHTTSKP